MRPAITVLLIVVGAAIATVVGLFLAAAISSREPEEFFNVYLVAFVLLVGGVGGLVVGGAAAIAWSVVAARSRLVRATCTGLATLLAMAALAVFISFPTGSFGAGFLLFVPAGILAAITAAAAGAFAAPSEREADS